MVAVVVVTAEGNLESILARGGAMARPRVAARLGEHGLNVIPETPGEWPDSVLSLALF